MESSSGASIHAGVCAHLLATSLLHACALPIGYILVACMRPTFWLHPCCMHAPHLLATSLLHACAPPFGYVLVACGHALEDGQGQTHDLDDVVRLRRDWHQVRDTCTHLNSNSNQHMRVRGRHMVWWSGWASIGFAMNARVDGLGIWVGGSLSAP